MSSSWETSSSRKGTAESGSSPFAISVTATMNDSTWSEIWTAKSSGSWVVECSVTASGVDGCGAVDDFCGVGDCCGVGVLDI